MSWVFVFLKTKIVQVCQLSNKLFWLIYIKGMHNKNSVEKTVIPMNIYILSSLIKLSSSSIPNRNAAIHLCLNCKILFFLVTPLILAILLQSQHLQSCRAKTCNDLLGQYLYLFRGKIQVPTIHNQNKIKLMLIDAVAWKSQIQNIFKLEI